MKKLVGAFITDYCDCMITDVTKRCIPDEWVQLTELVEIDFKEINQQEVLNIRIEKIDDLIKEENGKHYAEIKKLEQKKSELLAITYEAEAIADSRTDNETLEEDYNVK